MQKIQKLSPLEAQKIAAGEVIERPVNVVKELVENSLDAGATKISIYVQEGGNTLIRVVDNGCGMSQEDALFCFEHHATSKIKSIDDLTALATFGFRGEALSSIASVSTMTLQTREHESEEGTYIERDPNTIIEQQEIACAPGTDLTVSNLYFNVPARKKFLKKADTQWRSIVHLYQALCLAYPQVHFQLYGDGKIAYNCPGTAELKNRMAQLFDHTVADHMLALTPITKNGICISGIISDAHIYRYNRNQLFFFVNNRWVKNMHLSKAVMKGYANILPPDRFPIAAIFIECNPNDVDINVHPRKEEVTFLHPGHVESLITQSVATMLAHHVSISIKKTEITTWPQNSTVTAEVQTKAPTTMSRATIFPVASNSSLRPSIDPIIYADSKELKHPSGNPTKEQLIDQLFSMPIQPASQEHKPMMHEQHMQHPIIEKNELAAPEYKLLGVAHKTYIMLEHPEGIYFVDQHAAHECVLFERWRKKIEQTEVVNLMFPEIISIAPEHMQHIEHCLTIFAHYHIGIELFGEQSVIIRSAPLHAKSINWQAVISELLEEIDQDQEKPDFFERISRKVCAQIACKAAVKAGDELTESQITQLLHDLDRTESRTTCPHGRPTGWLLRLYEIEKKFKRIV